MDIVWHKDFAAGWLDRIEQGRVPHAVLLVGTAGVGKRAAAAWIASRQLGIGTATDLPQYPAQRPSHADLHWLTPAEDKATIGVEQIRDLVAGLSLTSHSGDGKVAVIEPANAMTHNAANSLLKTLEEPPGDTLLILIADKAGRLPATIFSRCQRIELGAPGEAAALAWLNRLQPGAAWTEALSLAGNAPLAAIGALELLDTHAAMSRDLNAVAQGNASPLRVAADWARLEPAYVLDWLSRQVQQAVLMASGGRQRPAAAAIGESVLKRMDRRNLFCYLDTINSLRGQPAGSFNVQLTFESLLIDWADGLANCTRTSQGGDLQLLAKR
jgi:DNA polymerase III subunit delta'